jgi:hypothetical protein
LPPLGEENCVGSGNERLYVLIVELSECALDLL